MLLPIDNQTQNETPSIDSTTLDHLSTMSVDSEEDS